jgi:DNA helicase-2/ATP-dependent DNA helicase PcrA
MWLGGRDEICVVGDPRQTIYSFTGASPGYLTGFPAEFPAAAVIRLVRNYRSTPEVVTFANKIVAAASPSGAGSLIAQRPAGPVPRLTEYPDEAAELAAVARHVQMLLTAGTPAAEIAVLVRTNAQTEGLEQAFAQSGVPFQLRGAERFFDRDEVRRAVGLIRAAAKSASAPDDPAAQIAPILATVGLTPQAPSGRGAARERWESLSALAQLAADFFAAHQAAGLADLSAELAVRSAIGHAPAMAGVTLASLHAAKGLEWQAVFMPGLTDGNVPIVYAQTDEAIEEERRLLYVGVTRARERLYLSWALARTPGGRRTRKPSRFLADVLSGRGRAAGERAQAGSRARGARGGGARAGDMGARGSSAPGSELFGRLRDWRLAVSREQSVPAYVVFSDATLQAIADARPVSRGELAAIPGVGAVKLDRYGAAVIELCADAAGQRKEPATGRAHGDTSATSPGGQAAP